MATVRCRTGLMLAMLAAVAPARAGDAVGKAAAAAERASPEFDRLKSLAGEWSGNARSPGAEKGTPTTATVRVVSAGSAVMLVTDPGTPHEMVTMFHRDGDALLATHYCAAMNQPRMKAQATSDPTKLAFEFMDGTNLGPHPARMQRLVIATPSADRQVQEWTFQDGATSHTVSMDLTRKK